jgi:hypothetical protein
MIKKYCEFILEFREITTHQSGSGKSKEVSTIYDDPSTDKTHSAAVLLKDKLKAEEVESILQDLNPEVKHRIKKFIDDNKIRSVHKVQQLMITFNNEKFLRDQKKKGPLRCEYCNHGPLVIYNIDNGKSFRKYDGATCDHKVPRSKGGDEYDYSNLAVCCYKCNQRKGNMDWEDWQKIMNESILTFKLWEKFNFAV